ncbi:MAG: hypothetical protein KBA11_08055 [Sedimentibacter sp.]|nr:hypothetical protein [Sedimentibacter sp.]
MRRIIALIMTAIFLLSSPISVLSSSYPDNIYLEWGPEQPETLEEAVTMANTEIGYEYFDIKEANRDLWENSMPKFLVYGSPHGDKKDGEYRYLGHTPEEEPFTNIKYPHDAWAGGYLDDRNWIEFPWRDKQCQDMGAKENSFNNNPNYEDCIKYGLKLYYEGYVKGTKHDWYKCVQILQPPTDYTFGMGRMWHKDAGTGKVWYITIPIIPLRAIIEQSDNQDYSTLIIRTGTENQTDGKPVANVQNEAVVEYRVTNSDKNTGIAEVELEIKNAKNIIVEGLLDAKISGEKITGKLNIIVT